jgi:hypothetical protein
MENNKIDRLFEDKLSRYEIDPSPAAWEAVHAQIDSTKRPVMIWYSVAAAIAAVAVVAVLVLRNDTTELTSGQMVSAQADYPKQMEPVTWDIPQPSSKVEDSAPVQSVRKQPRVVPANADVPRNETLAQSTISLQKEELIETLELIELNADLDAMAHVNVLDTTEELETIQTPPGVSVQITYKATPPVMVDEKSKIEKLWAKARDIRPGDVLGNIRESKNEFFNGKKK